MTFDSTKTVKPKAKLNPALTSRPSLQRPVAVAPPVQVRAQAALAAQYTRPVGEQRQVAAPALHAMTLYRQEEQRLDLERQPLQRQAAELSASLPEQAIPNALHRQAEERQPIQPPARPQSAGDWVTVMRAFAQQYEQKNAGYGLQPREAAQHTALQRQVAHALVKQLKTSPLPAAERYAQFAHSAVTLQRHPLTSAIPRAALNFVNVGERPALQRALDEATRAEALQRQQDERALQLHSIQRQLAELDEQATLPVMQRIQERRGAGSPLPAAIQRHLEQGLNHDLSRVRIHDDAEADKLAKGVNAVAFTTGSDIYFQSGQFNPNTQSGLELLAHEVTHTVQQSKGQVGKGIDPDAGLENEARAMGAKLAHLPATPKLVPPAHVGGPHAPGMYTHKAAVQRAQDGASSYFALKPLYDLQPQSVQRAAGDDLSIQRDFLGIPTSKADVLAKASGILKAIPGYEPLCLAFGKDLVTGQTFGAQGEGLLEKLADWAPGPLKDIIKALKETHVIGKAWEWFKGELGKLELGSVLSDIKNAIFKLPPDFGAAKDAIVRRVSGLKNLILGSARRIAEIGLTALTAGLGPIGQQIMAGLRSAGDSIIKILKDPVAFARNLIEAVKGGFKQFASNAPKNLGQVIGGWLGSNTGIEFPSKFDLPGILMTALSVMGLTYQAMRGRLVKALGPGGNEKVSKAETTVQALQTMRTGLHKADEMKSEGGSVSGEISEGIKSEVTQSVVMAGIQKLVTMLIPGGGFINAIIGAFQTVQTIVQQAANIGSLIVNGLSSIAAIAAGNIGSAVGSIERALVSGLSLALTWLTKVLGLGNLAGKIKNIIGKVKGKLDKVLDKIVAKVKGIIEKLMGKGKDKEKDGKPNADGTYGKLMFAAGKESHSVWTEVKGGIPEIYIASTPDKAISQLSKFKQEAVRLNTYGALKPHFSDAGRAVSVGISIMRKSISSTDRNIRLMINTQATEASNQIARYVGVIRRAIQEARTRSTRMPEISVRFSASEYPKDIREYKLQLFEQQTGINSKTIGQWTTQRNSFLANGRGSRSSQNQARNRRRAILIDVFSRKIIKDNPSISPVSARNDAVQLANQWLSGQAALHAPDQIAGSQAQDIVALGKKEINGSIGGSWPSRIAIIDSAVNQFTASNPQADAQQIKMNVSLSI